MHKRTPQLPRMNGLLSATGAEKKKETSPSEMISEK